MLNGKAGPSEPFCSGFWCRAGRRHGALLAGLSTSRENYSNFSFFVRRLGNHMNGLTAYFSAERDNLRACQNGNSNSPCFFSLACGHVRC